MEYRTLNVSYQSSDYYAPQTGVSMVSLFENNKDIPHINVFILDDGISDENRDRLSEVGKEYGRKITFLETSHFSERLRDYGASPFRGSYATYFKLFAINEIKTDNGLLLQIDGDTIVNSSLADLFDVDFGDDCICAACYECVHNSYKELIGIDGNDVYFNCGVLWVNQRNWRKKCCEERIIDLLKNTRSEFFSVDQDIINVLFRHEIDVLSPAFNFNSGFDIYGVKNSFYIYDLAEPYYYSQEIIESVQKKPIINHCMGAMTGRPWEKNNIHPQSGLYDHYLAMSPWKDIQKINSEPTMLFKIQRALYILLPRPIYGILHKRMLTRYLRKKNREHS